ncbi:MAG: class I tRNA ligase family protein, partial [Lachnospiraceae bacterium]|nr:class I tRNA ligase family protein [Lachnospiraceae bacterium]
KASKLMETLHVADCLTEIWTLFKRCNKYIDETEPWVLAKDEAKKDRLSVVLYNLLDCIAIGAALLRSFLPETAEKILSQLNTKEPAFDDCGKRGAFVSGTKVTEDPETLFERRKMADVMKKVDELYPPKKKD